MDFSGVAADTARGVSESIDYILGLNISPADKMARVTLVVKSVGTHYHDQLYDAASQVFGSQAMASVGLDDANAQAERLANKIVRNHSLSRDTAASLVREYYDTVLGRAQHEAFQNALSMQMHPTLTRTVIGETCKFCTLKARESPYTNPSAADFSRHEDCDCLFVVSGYNSRNGLLTNYVKRKAKK